MSPSNLPPLGSGSGSVLHIQLIPKTWETLQPDLLRNIFCLVSAKHCLDPVGVVCRRWRAIALSIARPCLLTPEHKESSPHLVTYKMLVPVSFKASKEELRTVIVTQEVGKSLSVNTFPDMYRVKNHCFRFIEMSAIPMSLNSHLIGGNSEHSVFLSERQVFIYNLTERSIFRWFSLPPGFGYGEQSVVYLAAISTLAPTSPETMVIMLTSKSHLIALLGSRRFLIQPLDACVTSKVRNIAFSDKGTEAFVIDSENRMYRVQLSLSGDDLDFAEVPFWGEASSLVGKAGRLC